jgi:hypothetical protein
MSIEIKDTSGIKQYFQDQGRAEILALDIKKKNPDKNSSVYKNANSVFNQAAGIGNGWTAGILFDAKIERKVDVSVENYKNSDAGKAVGSFLALDSGVRLKLFDPVMAAAVAVFVLTVVDKIEKQNSERVERAIEAIEKEFSRARWTTFELTTPEWVNKKYGPSGPEK